MTLMYIAGMFSFFALTCKPKETNPSNFTHAEKPAANPVIKADSTLSFFCPATQKQVKWQKADVFNPAAIIRNDTLFVIYRCEDNPKAYLGGRTSRLGLAYSLDGVEFTKYPEPVLYPAADTFAQWDYPGGCEDPRIVKSPTGTYILTYTSWNQKTARLSIATSRDLIHWEKKGPAFMRAYNGNFLNHWSKSGSIVCEWINDVQIAKKINGKYWMYWGEEFVNLAWSDDLINWYPGVDEKGELTAVIRTRPGYFDSRLTECGPPAMWMEEGVVLLYNGKNADDERTDNRLPKNTYTVGRVIFDKENISKVISRTGTCLIKPTLPHEISGQYTSGTVFSEGLVRYKGKWLLYYGTADSFVGLAELK